MNNFEVITAENGRAALDLLSGSGPLPELILSDIMMPEMNGYDFYMNVSDNPQWSFIPFIFLSAKSKPEDIRFGKQLGVDDYITKPFNEEDLLASIEGKIKRSKKSQEIRNQMEPTFDAPKSESPLPDLDENFVCLFYIAWNEQNQTIHRKIYTKCAHEKFIIDEITSNLFQIFQNTFGISGEAQDILLHLSKINMDGYFFFDFKQNHKNKDKPSPFILGILASHIHYLASLRLKEISDRIAGKIKKNAVWDEHKYINQMKEILNVPREQLKEVWIFYDSGIEIFSYAPGSEVEKDLLCGYLSAIQGLTQEMTKNKLDALSIGEDRYFFHHDKEFDFFILGRVSKYFLESNIDKILQEIANLFKTKYAKELKHLQNNRNIFKDFKKEIRKWIIEP